MTQQILVMQQAIRVLLIIIVQVILFVVFIILAEAHTPTWSVLNTLDYITIATTGNAQDFGDLSYVTQMGGLL